MIRRILFWVPTFSIISILISCVEAYNREYLIPNKFEGRILVVFDIEKGKSIDTSKDIKIQIPEDGILLLKNSFSDFPKTSLTPKFSYFKNKKSKVQLPWVHNQDELVSFSDEEIIIYNFTVGNFVSQSFNNYQYHSFIVSKKKKLNDVMKNEAIFLDSIFNVIDKIK